MLDEAKTSTVVNVSVLRLEGVGASARGIFWLTKPRTLRGKWQLPPYRGGEGKTMTSQCRLIIEAADSPMTSTGYRTTYAFRVSGL